MFRACLALAQNAATEPASMVRVSSVMRRRSSSAAPCLALCLVRELHGVGRRVPQSSADWVCELLGEMGDQPDAAADQDKSAHLRHGNSDLEEETRNGGWCIDGVMAAESGIYRSPQSLQSMDIVALHA